MTRQEKAAELFKNGYNCSQAVIGAFCDDLKLDFDTAMKISEGFGGGMGRMRLTCGAVSGMVMVIGMLLSRGEKEGDTRAEVYEKVHSLADKFAEKNGSIICSDLLGLNENPVYNPNPDARDKSYFQKRPCVMCVTDCVKLIEENFKM